MDLLIVRHAIAFDRNPRRWPDDGERPLSPEGMVRARRAATGLKRISERPLCVLTSPLLRAKQTATILSEFAAWPQALESPALAPDEPPEAVLRLLSTRKEKILALVGHQPNLGEVIAACLPPHAPGGGGLNASALELKKMGAALITFSKAVRAGSGTLVWLVPPRILRATQ